MRYEAENSNRRRYTVPTWTGELPSYTALCQGLNALSHKDTAELLSIQSSKTKQTKGTENSDKNRSIFEFILKRELIKRGIRSEAA